ncbi:MAG: AAA family ATPase [Desulfopila sp.]|jgi:cellulose biosynthesis protein BcsQ|nr:AAA family ATPase [Desulfopila sp.]
MKIIAVYCSKGGVGKTATSVNLAFTAARKGYASLLCDLDPQGASSYYFRIRPKKKFNSKQLLHGNLQEFIRETDFDDLDLLPAHFSHRNIDLLLDKEKEKKNPILRKVLGSLEDDYDLVFLDCPPNLTLLSENIISSADMVVTPVIPTTLSVLALQQLLKLCKKTGVNKEKVHAFFSMAEQRKSMHLDVISQYRKYAIFMKTIIPFLAEIEKMGVNRKPVGATQQNSRAALAYERLLKEIEKRGKLR